MQIKTTMKCHFTSTNTWQALKSYAKRKKPDTEGHVLYDSTYMILSEKANLERKWQT